MISAKIGDFKFRVTSLRGTDNISNGYKFDLTMASREPYISSAPIGEVIHCIYTGVISYWTGGYVQKDKIYVYKCSFYSIFESKTRFARYAIFKDTNLKDILQNLLEGEDFSYLCPKNPKYDYFVQHSETNRNIIHYLAFTNGLCYYLLDQKVIFTDSTNGMELVGEMQFTEKALNRSSPDVQNFLTDWRIEAKERYNWFWYGFNIANPNIDANSTSSGENSNFLYSPRLKSSDECDFISSNMAKYSSPRYAAKTCNPNLRAGTKINMTNHLDAGEYYVVGVTHVYDKYGYSNECYFQKSSNFLPAPRVSLNKINSLEIATVIGLNVGDSNNKGCKVQVKFNWSNTPSIYIPVLQTSVGNGYGSFFVPRIGSRVAIGFECGDPSYPFVYGAFYDGQNLEYETNGEVSSIVTKSGHKIALDDTENAQRIDLKSSGDLNTQVSSGNFNLVVEQGDCKINLSNSTENGVLTIGARELNIIIQNGIAKIHAPCIQFQADSIDLNGNSIQLTGTTVHISSTEITLNSTLITNIVSTGPVNVMGLPVNVT